MSHHKTFAEGYVYAQHDSQNIIQQELINQNTGAVEAEAEGDTVRAECCQAMAKVLERINKAVADLQPPAK